MTEQYYIFDIVYIARNEDNPKQTYLDQMKIRVSVIEMRGNTFSTLKQSVDDFYQSTDLHELLSILPYHYRDSVSKTLKDYEKYRKDGTEDDPLSKMQLLVKITKH